VTATAADLPLPVRDRTKPDLVLSSNTATATSCFRTTTLRKREYPDAADQIRKALTHENYLSQENINMCLGFDLAGIADRIEIGSIRTLHEVLKSEYGPDNEHGAA